MDRHDVKVATRMVVIVLGFFGLLFGTIGYETYSDAQVKQACITQGKTWDDGNCK